MRRIIPLLLALSASAPAAAQGGSTPDSAAASYLAAMRAADWQQVAGLIHPDALRELKTAFSALAARDSSGEFLQHFFQVRTPVEFDALPGRQVYARLLRAVTAASPEAEQAMRAMDAHVLGTVMETGDTAHVVYRMSTRVDQVPMRKVDVVSFRRAGGRWMALLTADLEGLTRSIVAEMEH